MITRRTLAKTLVAASSTSKPKPAPASPRQNDTERIIGDIDPKIYGNFAEHLC